MAKSTPPKGDAGQASTPFSLSIGGNVSGDVAQSIDKSQHQTTNVEGNVGTINNSQAGGDIDFQPARDALDEFNADSDNPDFDADLSAELDSFEALTKRAANGEEFSDEDATLFQKSIGFLKDNAPAVARVAGKIALSAIPGGSLLYGPLDAIMTELTDG